MPASSPPQKDEQRVELTGENALTLKEARALDRGLFELETQASPDTQHWKSARPKLRAALSQHTTSEGGSK